MLNSSVLDIALGLVFAFLAVSLITSAVVEAINSVLKLRSKTLRAGVQNLVNDPLFEGLAKQLYQHAAVNPRGSAAAPTANAPAYIDKLQFASALLDVTGLSDAAASIAAGANPHPDPVAALTAVVNNTLEQNPQMAQLLIGILQRSKGDIDKVRLEVAAWFDGAMDRVSGAFKRWTQWISFVVALLTACLLNVDSVHLATVLWQQPALAETLKLPDAMKQAIIKPDTSGKAAIDQDQLQAAAQAAASVLQENLPLGWPSGHFMRTYYSEPGKPPVLKGFWEYGYGLPSIFGWLATAFATLFGAPFWFDALQGIVRLKGSGPSPAEKASGSAASA